MGRRHSKILPLPIPSVVARISKCSLPEDRDKILDLVEMLDINLSDVKSFEVNTKQMKESNGMYVVLKLLKRLVEDVEMVSVCIQVMESIKTSVPLVMDFIQFGGLDLFDKAVRFHSKDDFVATSIPKIVKIVLAIGAAASIEEIRSETLNLKLCQSCQEAIERHKQQHTLKVKIVVPKPADRINRVLRFMENYLHLPDVQVAALDAVIGFTRNADARSTLRDTKLLYTMGESLKANPTKGPVVWRVCMAISLAASLHADYAYEIASMDLHELVVEQYLNHEAPEDEELQYFEIVIPVGVRTIVRETKGVATEEKMPPKKTPKFKERRNFDERPRFGTVDTRIFTKGDTGLVPKPGEIVDIGNERKIPDWEKRLNYKPVNRR